MVLLWVALSSQEFMHAKMKVLNFRKHPILRLSHIFAGERLFTDFANCKCLSNALT